MAAAGWRARWLLEPTTAAETIDVPKILVDETRSYAVQGSLMADGEGITVEMLMHDDDAEVWEPVVVQGEQLVLNAQYNAHTFVGPVTVRFVKTATVAAVGVADFEPHF